MSWAVEADGAIEVQLRNLGITQNRRERPQIYVIDSLPTL